MSSEEDVREIFDKDPRITCNYGAKCYQRNEAHRKKYKHPPPVKQNKKINEAKTKKRTWLDRKNDAVPKSKSSGDDSDCELHEAKKSCLLTEESGEEVNSVIAETSRLESDKKDGDFVFAGHSRSKAGNDGTELLFGDEKRMIREKFLVEMPPDFYDFYKLCKEISPGDPSNAFKTVNLLLVGPYDILNGKLLGAKIENDEQYLTHWRYFYDPPEFQTIIKGNDKEGLHFGYWRDEPGENPVFVAKNLSNIDCKIKPVAETVFGAVDIYLEETLKTTNPFQKPKIANLRQRLRKFATSHNIQLDQSTQGTRAREKRVVARTFHGAGIVVPYDKKTQLGYRELVATDANLKKILSRINEGMNEDERSQHLTQLEEVERLAVIAADECDFGTCLELGHDLFSSGVRYVQSTAIRMLSTAYNLLNRLEFSEIVKAHFKSRKQGSALGIV